MPSFGPHRKQVSVKGDGSAVSYDGNASFPGGIARVFGPFVRFSTNQVLNQFCNAPAVPVTEISDASHGIEHSYLQGYDNSRDFFGDLSNAPVLHEKFSGNLSPLLPWRTLSCGGFGNQTATPIGVWYPSIDYTLWRKAIEAPPSSILRPLCDEAFNRFHTMFPEELSVANFIYELREVSSLIPKLSKSIRKSVAGGYLNLEFGWKPLIGDIQTMLHVLDRVQERLNWLKRTYKKKTRLGYSSTITWKPSGFENTTRRVQKGAGLAMDYVGRSYTAKFTAGGRLYHEVENLDEMYGQVRALAGVFGFTNPTKIIWNMIPYSFVLGWFTNIESLIDRYANLQQLATDWRVDRMTHSVKVESYIDVYQLNVASNGAAWWRQPRGYYHCQCYRRYVGLSVTDSILTLSSPSTKQQALLAALVAGRNY